MWGFPIHPKMGVPPCIIHLMFGFSIDHPAIGVWWWRWREREREGYWRIPILWKPPCVNCKASTMVSWQFFRTFPSCGILGNWAKSSGLFHCWIVARLGFWYVLSFDPCPPKLMRKDRVAAPFFAFPNLFPLFPGKVRPKIGLACLQVGSLSIHVPSRPKQLKRVPTAQAWKGTWAACDSCRNSRVRQGANFRITVPKGSVTLAGVCGPPKLEGQQGKWQNSGTKRRDSNWENLAYMKWCVDQLLQRTCNISGSPEMKGKGQRKGKATAAHCSVVT